MPNADASKCPSQCGAVQVGAGELVPAVRHLVEYERSSLAAADTIAAAEGVVAADPSLLLHRIVAQFQHLFDCPRLQGVLPALNQVAHAPADHTLPRLSSHSIFLWVNHPLVLLFNHLVFGSLINPLTLYNMT